MDRFPSDEHQYGSKLSQTLNDSGPATPDTDAGTSGQFRRPPLGGSLRRPSLGAHSKNASSSSLEEMHRLHAHSALSRSARNLQRTGSLTAPVAGVSATPPIVEGDLEQILPFETEDLPRDSQQPRRPQAIDTIVAQDASLPSPSLSPITAAAANANALALTTQENEEDENEVSSLEQSSEAKSIYRFTSARPSQTVASWNHKPAASNADFDGYAYNA